MCATVRAAWCLSIAAGMLLLTGACGDDGGARPDAGLDAGLDGAPPDSGLSEGGDDAEMDAAPVVIVLPDEREACADPDPLRRPFFGDLHVHTRFSFDAAGWGSRATPADAYRFARGEPIGLAPYDADGNPTRTIQLRRPLDFAAVTDHAEYFAEVPLCTDPSSEGYDSRTCQTFRDGNAAALDFGELSLPFLNPDPRPPQLCRDEPDLCASVRTDVWTETQDAAERFYDRSASCEFTTFVGWEWSGVAPGITNIHRNVLFRSRTVPRVPVSYIDAPTPERLWRELDARCTDTDTDCAVLAIPHNSNVGGGNMFNPVTEDGSAYTREVAAQRTRLEPLLEIYQHKGASECLAAAGNPLASEDELCAFEQLHAPVCTGSDGDPPDCTPVCGASQRPGGFLGSCVEPGDFARPALRSGLLEWERLGVNPFELGFIGSTDTHNAAAGHVEEDLWEGHLGERDGDPVARLRPADPTIVGIRTNSPGGLAVLWAEENTREALFDAMKRREAYATSGTRIVVRFFGGWEYPADLCDHTDLVEQGYASGVPMGGELADPPSSATSPTFVVSALRDPGADGWEGTPLQRIQIVKGWVDGIETRERVYEIAGDPDNGAAVDLDTCEPTGEGSDALCARWSDPDFDPAVPAFYYARVVENPTCRWSHRLCRELAVDCGSVEADDPLAACCGALPPTVQERAWTSPIWYYPE